MSDSDRAPGYVPNPHYGQDDWDEVSDHPELTDEQLSALRPADETVPLVAAALRRVRAVQLAPTKALLSLRVDRDVLEAYRASGPGWQGRMNAALREAIGLGKA